VSAARVRRGPRRVWDVAHADVRERSIRDLGDPKPPLSRYMGNVPYRLTGKQTETKSREAEGAWGVRPVHSTLRRESRSHGEGTGRSTTLSKGNIDRPKTGKEQCEPH
jgi:hypothetical protein